MNWVADSADSAGAPGDAPGAPGIAPTWTSSAKDLVGTSLGPARLWFTTGFGIVNEVYFPRADLPQIRDLGFIVADGAGFWVEVKRLGHYRIELAAPGVPAACIVHRHERFTLSLRITPDPERDALLIELRLDDANKVPGQAANGSAPGLRLYALLAPHLGGSGADNCAEVGRHGCRRVLWAEQGPFGLALAAVDDAQRDAWLRGSAGYVGASDGWQDFDRHAAMRWEHRRAGPGNVALIGELPRRCVLALGLASSREAAAALAIAALAQPFERPWQRQVAQWTRWHAELHTRLPAAPSARVREQVAVSAMVLRAHQDKIYPGAIVASLGVPWGNRSDERGGYHLVWPRDLVECAGALIALGELASARNVLRYLIATQQADGHWHQNQWLGGKPYWRGVQLDEAAFPVLLAALLAEHDALDGIEVGDLARRAIAFIARTGPASEQDRWEEDAGVNAFTLAVCIAALVAGARFVEPGLREFALALADDWNARIEDLTAVFDTALARRLGVRGYYVRVAPPAAVGGEPALQRRLPIRNRIEAAPPADEQVATDVLQLVRFGLRRADDPLIVDTVRVIDALLKVDTPRGAAWRRYSGDGYGEHEDGAPFDGTGCGRPWPLLAGERGHYELLAGRDPRPALEAMAAMAGGAGMIPEQVWDGVALPARRLLPGRPTGSAMPLAWAHAEFVKLAASAALGRACDCPSALVERYRGERPTPRLAVWLEQARTPRCFERAELLVCLRESALVHWGADGWRNPADVLTQPVGPGLHVARLPTAGLRAGQTIEFTWRSRESGRWVGTDHRLAVAPPGPRPGP
ncbi:MAG: glucan 1,4-alpha-glucosidase [Burkholderiaceae bacterium]|nr:glucan 1,4-alpha-glucosidase [Burkholderiaceae bacterium]